MANQVHDDWSRKKDAVWESWGGGRLPEPQNSRPTWRQKYFLTETARQCLFRQRVASPIGCSSSRRRVLRKWGWFLKHPWTLAPASWDCAAPIAPQATSLDRIYSSSSRSHAKQQLYKEARMPCPCLPVLAILELQECIPRKCSHFRDPFSIFASDVSSSCRAKLTSYRSTQGRAAGIVSARGVAQNLCVLRLLAWLEHSCVSSAAEALNVLLAGGEVHPMWCSHASLLLCVHLGHLTIPVCLLFRTRRSMETYN